MAKLTEREVVILVKALGLDKAIAGFDKLDSGIKRTQKTSGELDRNMKGTANITSNTTKAFAKQAQGLGGLVHVYATVAANVFALSSAFNVLKSNADLKIMEQASRQLSVASGTNFNLVAKSLKEVTGGAISMKEAMQTATLGLRGGATSTQLQQITDVATKAAKALGRSVPEAVTRLTQAVIKGEPELADEFGIILRVEEAVKKYAAAHNKAATSLTTFERQQAIINQAIEQGNKKYGELKLDTNPYDKLAATFSELTQKILQFVSTPIGAFFKVLADNTTLMTLAILAFAKAVAQRALPEVFKLGAAMIDNAKKASSEAIIAYNAQGEALDKLAKKQAQYASIARTKKINVLGVLGGREGELSIKSALPKLAKEIDAAKGDTGKIAQTLFRNFYSQIHKEAKKFGGDITKVMVDNIRNPLQKEFLLMGQEVAKLGKGINPAETMLKQTIAGVRLTAQEYKYLNQVIQLYRGELTKGVSANAAMIAAQEKLSMSTAGVRAAFGKIIVEGRQLYGGFATLKLGLTQGSQLMQQGALQGKNLKESVALVSKELEKANVNLDRVNPRVLAFGVGIGKGIGAVANFASAIGSIIGGFFNFIIVITLVWEGLKVLANWLGITNSKVDEITNTFSDMQKELDTTNKIIQEYIKNIKEAAESTLLLGAKIDLLAKKAAIFDTLATQAKEFAKKMRQIAEEGGEGWQIFGRSDAIKEATTQFKTQLEQFKAMTGKLPELTNINVQNLITPEEVFKNFTSDSLTGYLTSTLKEAFIATYKKAKEQGMQVFNAAGELTKEFSTSLKITIDTDEAYKGLQIFKGGVESMISDLNNASTISFFDKLGQLDQGTLLQNFIAKLETAKKITPEIGAELALWYEVMERNASAASIFSNIQKSSLEDIGSTIAQVNKDVEDSLKNLNTDTTGGMEKSVEKIIGVAMKLKGVFESYPDPKDIDPFAIMMEKAPQVLKYLNLTKENFSTQEQAVKTLGTIIESNLAKFKQQAQLTVDIAIAENNLAIAKRQTAAVESKSFAEKKAAYEKQFEAEKTLIELQIKQIELRITELEQMRAGVLELQAQAQQQQNISAQLLATLALRDIDTSITTARGQLEEYKASLATLPGLKEKALGKVDSAAAKSGESAADKAQKQAEKMANLEASIAKKKLERASMFLALEKELGDAVESRMEWELTGAREAVALGSKRIAILGRELSMQAALVPMKKAVMEAEAHALEVKAAGLEKDGEIKAAEEARLEVANKRQEMNNLDIEYITMRLEYEQKLYDIALKQHDLRKRAMIPTFKEGSGIQGSEEFFQTAKVEFALRWDKFLDEMTTPVDRLLDAFEGVVNSGVDAFVEAIANGENALQAAGDAIKQTMFELAKEWLKEDIKNLIYSTVGSFLGMEDPKDALKNELLKQTQQQKMQHVETINRMDVHTNKFDSMINLLGQINSKAGMSNAGGMQQQIPMLTDALFGMTQSQYDSVSTGLDGLFSSMPGVFGSGMSEVSNTVSSGFSMLGASIGGLGTILGGILLMSSNIFGSNKEVKDSIESKETEELPMYAKNLEEQRKIDAAKLNGTLDKQAKDEEESNDQLLKAGLGIATILGSLYLSNSDIFKSNNSINSSVKDLTNSNNKTGSDILSQLGGIFSLQSDSSKNALELNNTMGSFNPTPEFNVQPISTLGIESAIYGSNNAMMNNQLGLFDSLSSTFSDNSSLQVDTLNNVINAQNNTSNNIVWKLEELNANQNSNFNSLLSSQDNFFNTMGGLVNFNTPSLDQSVIDTTIPNETISELGYNNSMLANTFEYKIDSLVASNTELNTTLANNQSELLDFLSTSYENNLKNNTPLSTDQNTFNSVIDTLTTEQTGVFEEATNQFTDVFSIQNDTMETVQKDLNTTFSTTNTNLSGTFTMHEQTFTQISDAFLAKLNSISLNGQGGVGSGLSSGLNSMFGMTQGQYNNVSTGLEDMFNQQPDIFGSNAGLSGQLDSLFAAQPDVFGATPPGYASAFGASPSFGMGGLGTSFMNMFGTMPTMPTQPLNSGDIFSGSNPLSMSPGSMLNMTGMGGMMAPFQSLTQGIAGVGQSLMTGLPTGGMAQPMAGGMMGGGMAQPMAGGMMGGGMMGGGMMGGLSSGLGMSSMMMSMIPMLMGGIGGGSPAGQAAKEKSGSGSSSSDASLGSGGSEDVAEELKDTTEEMKDELEKLLTEIKDNVIEIKINAIDFQIEHMEKIDKNFQVWLATFQLAHMQDLMLMQSMATSLMSISMSNSVHTQYLAQIAGCTCQGGMGMAKGGIVAGMIRGYAKGAITTGPELAMIGEGTKREAIVPLPDNRSIPVTLTNDEEKEKVVDNRPINITINGVEGTEKGLRRSAAQIAYEVNRTSRNKVMRY